MACRFRNRGNKQLNYALNYLNAFGAYSSLKLFFGNLFFYIVIGDCIFAIAQ